MDAWDRQRALARTTTFWGAGSIAVGVILAVRSDRWWRAFGQQNAGWGAVDLGIVAVVNALQARRMRRLPDPYAPEALEHERGSLHRVLLVNVGADLAYVVVGAALWRRRHSAMASGAGAAIVVQGLFLALHDAYHAYGSRA